MLDSILLRTPLEPSDSIDPHRVSALAKFQEARTITEQYLLPDRNGQQ